MDLNDILLIAAINASLLALLILIVWLVRRRQPMAAPRLRREVKKLRKTTDVVPFSGDFCRMRMMLTILEGGVSDERAVTALLLGWAAQERFILKLTDKKRLKSFGATEQATICFPIEEEEGAVPSVQGAENMILRLLYGWADKNGTLQEGELYNCARQYHSAVQGRLDQLDIQGRHGLRAAGEMFPENKKRGFGFIDQNRPIYTPRGVREAAALRGYQMWLAEQTKLPAGRWRDSVLCGYPQGVDEKQMMFAAALARALIGGMRAGQKVVRV